MDYVFQKDVYAFAATVIKTHKLKSVLDIGCGDAFKLGKYLRPLTEDITGVDIFGLNIPDYGKWIKADIEKDDISFDKEYDLIICSDIIEHLENPENLFKLIRKGAHENTYILFSTPDGDTTRKLENGKPANLSHVQEWSREGFKNYLEANGFIVCDKRYSAETMPGYPYLNNAFLCKIGGTAIKKVLISVTNEHWIHKTVVNRILRLQQDRRYKLNIILPTHKPYENNLHHIVKDVLSGGYDFWLNIDSDNPPERNPLDLIELNKDVIGLPTPIIHFDKEHPGDAPVYWNAYDYVKEADAYKPHSVYEGLQRVDAVGTGCVLFARRVFEHLEMQKGCFTRKLNPDGTVNKGNDISFCERAVENGFEIYAHFDYFCSHENEIDVNEMVEMYRKLFEKLNKEK